MDETVKTVRPALKVVKVHLVHKVHRALLVLTDVMGPWDNRVQEDARVLKVHPESAAQLVHKVLSVRQVQGENRVQLADPVHKAQQVLQT